MGERVDIDFYVDKDNELFFKDIYKGYGALGMDENRLLFSYEKSNQGNSREFEADDNRFTKEAYITSIILKKPIITLQKFNIDIFIENKNIPHGTKCGKYTEEVEVDSNKATTVLFTVTEKNPVNQLVRVLIPKDSILRCAITSGTLEEPSLLLISRNYY